MLELIHRCIPPGLDEMEPGPVLAGYLASIDVASVSGHDRVVVLRAHKKMASHYEAQVYRDMAAVADAFVEEGEAEPGFAPEAAAAEVRAALALTARAADVEMAFAVMLRSRLPRVSEMLMSGDIDVRRARTIDFVTSHVSDAVARAAVDRVAHAASSLTTGQLRARLQKLCIAMDPEDARRRYESAVELRRVTTEVTPDGTVEVVAHHIEPHRAALATRRINTIARSLKRDGETRTMDQLRADVAIDLLIGRTGSATNRGTVEIRVDLDTLCHLNDHPGDLDGYGPVIADIARRAADSHRDAEWRFTVTDTPTNNPLMTGTTRRRPNAALRRHVESRNPTCVFPGCRHPSSDCDIDHTTPWAEGGRTEPGSVAPVCRRDHVIRHAGRWTYVHLPDGTFLWTSPLGHTYVTGTDPP
jgi:hypothetical protein